MSYITASEYLQFESFSQKERDLFTSFESKHMIDSYNSLFDDNLSKNQKMKKIKDIVNLTHNTFGKNRKKILILVIFSMTNTPFGHSLLQEYTKFRDVVFEAYERNYMIGNDDQDFLRELDKKKI